MNTTMSLLARIYLKFIIRSLIRYLMDNFQIMKLSRLLSSIEKEL